MSPPAPGDVPRLDGVRAVGIAQPLRWLALGWADLVRCPLPGLLHGLVTAAFGALLLGLAGNRFWLLAGGFSGFLLVAPLLATGLYAVSRALEEGRPAGLATALAVWRPNNGRLMLFGVLLAFAGTGWVLTSASLITRFAEAPVHNPQDFLRVVVLSAHGHLFEGWLLLGSALAAPIFASTVVTVPLLMDRNIDRNTDRDTDRNAYRDTDRIIGLRTMSALIDALSSGVPLELTELTTLGRTLKRRAADVLAYFTRPGTSNVPEAIKGRLEHLRGSALGFRNLTICIARSVLETGGFRPRLHPQL